MGLEIKFEDRDKLLEFEIELYDNMKMSLNKIWGGVHWGVRSSFRNIWHDEVYEKVNSDGIKKINRQVHIHFEYKFRTRYLDTTNCSVMNKAILDGLVENGILLDDTPFYVTSESTKIPLITQGERRKLPYDLVRVTLFDCGSIPGIKGENGKPVRAPHPKSKKLKE